MLFCSILFYSVLFYYISILFYSILSAFPKRGSTPKGAIDRSVCVATLEWCCSCWLHEDEESTESHCCTQG